MRQGYRIAADAFHLVIPAQAGIHLSASEWSPTWVPAFAGTTVWFAVGGSLK